VSDQWSNKPLDWVKHRNLGSNPRCPACKSEPPFTGEGYWPGAMFHPAHPFGPCWVTEEGIPCGCTHGVVHAP
jgi:hypothetical protein